MLREGRTVFIPASQQPSPVVAQFLKNIIYYAVVVGFSIGLFFVEKDWSDQQNAIQHMRYSVVSLGENPALSNAQRLPPQSIVHFTSNQVSAAPIVDPGFNFGVQNSFKLRRVTEYCQWVETWDEKTDEQGNKLRTYYYGLQWLDHHVSSLSFDQPFRHNNPNRDPFHDTTFLATDVKVGGFKLTSELVDRVEMPWRHIYYDSYALQSVAASSAAQVHRFQPIGNGYFYSVYEESMAQKLAKFAGMALEGSMNIQLADFFEQCTAGDIRIHFEAIDALPVGKNGISVIGQFSDYSNLEVGVHVARNEQQVGLLVGGYYADPQALLDRHLNNSSWGLWFIRLVLSPVIAFFTCWSIGSPTSFVRIVALSIEIWVLVFSFANGFSQAFFIATKNIVTSLGLVLIFAYASLSSAAQKTRPVNSQNSNNNMPAPSAPPKDD